VFKMLARTPLAEETRQTWDRSRTMKESVKIFAETLAIETKKSVDTR
jgi:hypothetical protein